MPCLLQNMGHQNKQKTRKFEEKVGKLGMGKKTRKTRIAGQP